jgi:hypothetical protein
LPWAGLLPRRWRGWVIMVVMGDTAFVFSGKIMAGKIMILPLMILPTLFPAR